VIWHSNHNNINDSIAPFHPKPKSSYVLHRNISYIMLVFFLVWTNSLKVVQQYVPNIASSSCDISVTICCGPMYLVSLKFTISHWSNLYIDSSGDVWWSRLAAFDRTRNTPCRSQPILPRNQFSFGWKSMSGRFRACHWTLRRTQRILSGILSIASVPWDQQWMSWCCEAWTVSVTIQRLQCRVSRPKPWQRDSWSKCA
jgi:hypothetical protein